jgi:hypothetical protein
MCDWVFPCLFVIPHWVQCDKSCKQLQQDCPTSILLYHYSPICRFIKHSLTMKASRYLRVSLAKARCYWCMETSCITSTGTGKETIEHSIACGVAEYNEWVQQPDNAPQRNKDDNMVPYLKRHFIYINYAKSMYHAGSGKVTNHPSCVLEFTSSAYAPPAPPVF